MRAVVRNPKGEIVQDVEKTSNVLPTSKVVSSKFEWYFSDYSTEGAYDICTKILLKMETFIQEANNKFP